MDAVNDGLAVLQDRLPELRASPKPGRDDELASTVASSADLDNEWNVEVVTGDFGDAYMHFAVKEEEPKHCLVRKPAALRRSRVAGGRRHKEAIHLQHHLGAWGALS